VQAAVDRVNASLSRTEQIRRFVVIGRELTAEAGDLTPTLKLRRTVVAEKFRGELDALYQSAG
jgi:long-chain acyl-CoA synthetase